MNTKFLLGAVVASAFCMPMSALAASDTTHPTEFIKDSAVTTAVKAKLAAEHISSLANIHVDTDKDGVVWLRGTVETQEQADRAVAIARQTEHVTDVHSDLLVASK